MKYLLFIAICFLLFSCAPVKYIPCDCSDCDDQSKPLVPVAAQNYWKYQVSGGRIYYIKIFNPDKLSYFDGEKERNISGFLTKMYYDDFRVSQSLIYYISCSNSTALVQVNSPDDKTIITGKSFLNNPGDTIVETEDYLYEYSFEKNIRIPAGTFDCIVVNLHRKMQREEQEYYAAEYNALISDVHEETYYFARGVGLVKVISQPIIKGKKKKKHVMELLEYELK